MGWDVPAIPGYTELAGSPRESLGEGSGPSAERKFLVPWTQRLAFAQAIVSNATAYPHYPMTARIVGIDMEPWQGDDSLVGDIIIDPSMATAGYGTGPCLVTVKYGPDFTQKSWPSSFPKPNRRFGTELRFQIRGSAQFICAPAAACKWEDSDTAVVPEDVNSTVLVTLKGIQIQWDFVDDPPILGFDNTMGKVNSDSFLGAAPETLLFESYDVTETFRSGVYNPHTNRCTVNLTQRLVATGSGYVGWNHEYREEPAGWAKLQMSDGQPRYKLAPFGGIFA